MGSILTIGKRNVLGRITLPKVASKRTERESIRSLTISAICALNIKSNLYPVSCNKANVGVVVLMFPELDLQFMSISKIEEGW
ncbi:MAG: hypothetical protein A3D28_02125 [Omnitrophica bacterium RIFCSPHIGHO2_02_FULL_63_14]|nr:MAG: hypothetical protein A3D28_02125 [Omnitrophica bacterium RIFCSPHIGHO2_02_FULL_63_14]